MVLKKKLTAFLILKGNSFRLQKKYMTEWQIKTENEINKHYNLDIDLQKFSITFKGFFSFSDRQNLA